LKNDKVDVGTLARLRPGLLPEAWIAPPAIRQLQALLRNRIHAVLAQLDRGFGVHVPGGAPVLCDFDLVFLYDLVIFRLVALLDVCSMSVRTR